MASGWNRHPQQFAGSLGPDLKLYDVIRSLAHNAIVASIGITCIRACPPLLGVLDLQAYQPYVESALMLTIIVALCRLLHTLQLWRQSKSTAKAQQALKAPQRHLLGLSPAPKQPADPTRRSTIPPSTPPPSTTAATPPAASQLGRAPPHSPWSTPPITPGSSTYAPLTPMSASSFSQRASPMPSNTTPVTTPEQALKYQALFAAPSPLYGDPLSPDAVYPAPDFDVVGAPSPLPLGRDATPYHPSWMHRKAAAAASAESGLKVAAKEEVAQFLSQVLHVSQRHLDDWTDRLREWLSLIALRPLLARIDAAHAAPNDLLALIGEPLRLPPLTAVVGGAAAASAHGDVDAALEQCKARAQQLAAVRPAEARQLHGAAVQYQQLLLLLRGKRPADILLPPGPPSYILARLTQLASPSSCLEPFQWNGGGRWNGRPWSPDLPNDSSLVLYIFAAALTAPGWDFTASAGRGMPLYLGQLPSSRISQYSAILAQRIDRPGPGVDAIMATASAAAGGPLFTVLLEGSTVTLSGAQGVFHAIILFLLYHKQQYNGMLGDHYLSDDALRLAEVLEPSAAAAAGGGMLTFWRQRLLRW